VKKFIVDFSLNGSITVEAEDEDSASNMVEAMPTDKLQQHISLVEVWDVSEKETEDKPQGGQVK
jgi:hypothetical protein